MKRFICRAKAKTLIGSICMREDLLLDGEYRRKDGSDSPYRLEYSSDERDVQVRYIDDHRFNATYIEVSGADASDLVKALLKRIEVVSLSELKSCLDSAASETERTEAAFRLGLLLDPSAEKE